MENIGLHITRTLLMYVSIFLIIRLMGKREIGKQSVFDLVIFVMIAEMAVIIIEDTKRPLLHGLLPMAVLFIVQVALAFITLKSRRLRLFFDGKPTVLVDRGVIDRDAMRKQRYSLDDLMQQMRENQVGTLSDVDFAILEPSGKLSIIKKDSASQQEWTDQQEGQQAGADQQGQEGQKKQQPSSTTPFPKQYHFESLPVPLVMDGKIIEDNLTGLEKDRFWLNSQLKSKGVHDLKDIFLCTIDHRGDLYINMDRPLRQ